MHLGIYTECLGSFSLDEMLDHAARLDLRALEIATGNWSRPAHINLDHLLNSAAERSSLLAKIAARDLWIEALNCSGNHLEPNLRGKEQEKVVYKTFELAELLGVEKVVMMSGLPGGGPAGKYPIWITNTWPPVFSEMLEYQWNEVAIPWWQEAVRRAQNHGIQQIALENHPNTLVYNRKTICRLRETAGDIIGINLDPSHTFYMGGDPLVMAKQLAKDGLIYHVHAKDTRIETEQAALETLIELAADSEPPTNRSWNYVAVGAGHSRLWWSQFLAGLKMHGYDGVVSLEVGDGLLGELEGIERSAHFLQAIML
ncbi:MAG TPA: sugar phosphate isomerase/epimerase [Clostridiaceae bacterium]|nr:sugar phosphate isomerase/epimerase [Clostridiaceae bacterium]